LWAFVLVLVTIGAVIAAVVQLRAFLRESEARSRPFVIVDYTFSGQVIVNISVKNISASAATNVRLTVDSPFLSTLPDRSEGLAKVFNADWSIPLLAPSREIVWTYDRGPNHFAREDFVKSHTVTVTYEDPRVLRGKRRGRYTDTFVLSLEQWSEALAEKDWDNTYWNIANRNEKRMEKIAVAAKSIQDTLTHWGEKDEDEE
jgi:hypothetical protein